MPATPTVAAPAQGAPLPFARAAATSVPSLSGSRSARQASLPAHLALRAYLYPNGEPERPSAEDYAEAARFVDEDYRPRVCPAWFERNREWLVNRTAESIRFDRRCAERRERFAAAREARHA